MKVPTSECKRATGRMSITIRWIDIIKGDQDKPNYRSRVAAREMDIHKRDDLFAATPPLEALKVILSMVAFANKGEVIMVNDSSRAFSMQRWSETFTSNYQTKIGGPGGGETCAASCVSPCMVGGAQHKIGTNNTHNN